MYQYIIVMKKYLVLAAIIGFSVATLCSCGGKSTSSEEEITVTGSDGKVYANYREACRNCDFDAAYSILEKNREKFEKFKEENKFSKKNDNKKIYDAMVRNYEEGMDYVFNAEMLYLTSQNTEEASNRILYLLAEIEIPGIPPAAGKISYEKGDYYNLNSYIEGIARFNNKCNNVLNMAIVQKNEKLAHGVVKLMKQNVGVVAEYPDDEVLYVGSKNNTDIDLAKKKLDDAIQSGAFK